MNIKSHLERLWKAILQEDFVFSFQNTFEIVAFKTLDAKYADWSWSFKNEITEWERTAQNKLCGCTADQLHDVYGELLQSLKPHVWEKYMNYEAMMNEFFEENNEILLKWKPDTEARLQHLHENLERHAHTHCLQLYQSRKGRAIAENQKDELSVRILEHVQKLVGDLGEQKMGEDEVIKIFEDKWDQWMHHLTDNIKPLNVPNISNEVEASVLDFYKQHHMDIHRRIGDVHSSKYKPLREWGSHLQLKIMEYHIYLLPTYWQGLTAFWKTRKCSDYYEIANTRTFNTLSAIGAYLAKLEHSEENFNPHFVTELLRIIQSNRKIDSEEFQFTNEYEVEMSLIACGYAIPVFEVMADVFKRLHDPVDHIKYVMKPHFTNVFLNKYHLVDDEKIAAETVCLRLEEPIKECVMESLSSLIVNEMRGLYPWVKTKPSLMANILLEIGQKLDQKESNGFKRTNFLTDAESSLKYWARYFTKTHCDSGTPSRLVVISGAKLFDTIKFIIAKVKLVTESLSKQQTFSVHEWLRQFHVKVGEEIILPLGTLYVLVEEREFPDAEFFSREVIKGLDELHSKLKKLFNELKYSNTIKKLGAHEILLEQVAGCTEQCPFCKAQCELTNSDHPAHSKCPENKQEVNHSTQHRPQCLGMCSWNGDNTMLLDICTSSVASDVRFKNKDTDGNWHPYREYKTKYPDWSISADKSLEASLYWKWFIGHYSTEIEKYFGRAETVIPEEWREIKWGKVEKWLKVEYNL